MTAKHTPGPWRALDRMVTLDTDDLSCVGAIATTHVRRTARPIIVADVARANAKLIAAAPALADALESLLSCVEGAIRAGVLDPRNGNTADNGIDEGEVLWSPQFEAARLALRAAGRLP